MRTPHREGRQIEDEACLLVIVGEDVDGGQLEGRILAQGQDARGLRTIGQSGASEQDKAGNQKIPPETGSEAHVSSET